MLFPVYFGWGLLIPAFFSLIYGFTAYRAMEALGYRRKGTVWEMTGSSLPALFLFTAWGIVDIPLPLVYILAYFGKMFRLFRTRGNSAKELLLINLTHLTTMSLHMILIGMISLIVRIPMNELLGQPFWRISTISTVLAVNNLVMAAVPHWNMILEVFRTQSESEEVRPFMVFLLFCNAFLLTDSILCVVEIDWGLLPVFLIGSTVLLEFYLIRFLRHLYSILKVYHLEEEHNRLLRELEQKNQISVRLRSISTFDALTGVFSRRYLMEQADIFISGAVPFSLVFIDLDHLKQINDNAGHNAGDLYLIRFAKEFGSCLRGSDIFARIGGDEFIVLLPDCPPEAAKARIEEIRIRLSENPDTFFPFSYGITSGAGDSGVSARQLIQRADQAMYQDKQTRS